MPPFASFVVILIFCNVLIHACGPRDVVVYSLALVHTKNHIRYVLYYELMNYVKWSRVRKDALVAAEGTA